MRQVLTNIVVGICVVACVAVALMIVSGAGRIAIALMAAPSMSPPDFKTQMAMGIVLVLVGSVFYHLGKWVRGLW